MEGGPGSSGGGREERFFVSADPRSAAASPELESLNVCRVAALSALLGDDTGVTAGLASELEAMGFPPALATGRRNLGYADPAEVLAEGRFDALGESRMGLWSSIQENLDAPSGLGFLVSVLGSPLERESVAAAAALRRALGGARPGLRRDSDSFLAMESEEGNLEPIEWNGRAWRSGYAESMSRLPNYVRPMMSLRSLVRRRLRQGLRSPDPVTVSLAAAPGLPAAALPLEPEPGAERAEADVPAPTAPTVSTMIHGTWGWKGDWWRPGGGFHRFVRAGLRPNLYAQGARFSWSGYYRESHRVRACTDFREWGEAIAPHGLQSVFGHSYGGEVAARAVLEGVPIGELVLLSAPVTEKVVAAIETGVRVVDVRLRFDPVLLLAGTPQTLPSRSNVTTVRLKRRTLRHSATHDERVWGEENIAGRAGL